MALFGTNNIGMDVYSQTLYAGGISLSVGLVGVLISFVLGGDPGRHFRLLRRLRGGCHPAPDRVHSEPAAASLGIALSAAIPNNWSGIGLGILPPEVSWGSMMQQARSLIVIFNYPWHLIPTIFIVTAVLAFNFIGDGLRDAADPYSR